MTILDTNQFIAERMKINPITRAELDQIKQEMRNHKYELSDVTTKTRDGVTLYRIKALKDIPSVEVKKGDLGGWIESYTNLDQKGDCWVADNAEVFGNAKVYGNACVWGKTSVYGNAKVYDDTHVYGNAKVYGNAEVHNNAYVYGSAQVYGNANVYGNAKVYGTAKVDYEVEDENINK